jgi:hypothetical protein
MEKLFEENVGQPIKWEDGNRCVNGTEIEWGTDSCPLCDLFYWNNYLEPYCEGCCIFDDTGQILCKGTPYRKYEYCVFDLNKVTKDSVRAVCAVREYLENLYIKLYRRRAR